MGQIRIGTLHDDLTLGAMLRIGYFNPYFSSLGQVKKSSEEGRLKNRFQFYLYFKSEAKFVIYNSLLQGGLFNKSNIYTMQTVDIEPSVFKFNTGAVIQYYFIQLLVEANFLSKEIIGGRSHKWLNIGFRINF